MNTNQPSSTDGPASSLPESGSIFGQMTLEEKANITRQANGSSLANGSPLADYIVQMIVQTIHRQGNTETTNHVQSANFEHRSISESPDFDEPNMDKDAASNRLEPKQLTESIAGTDKQQISFLDLPPELRQMVYGYAMNYHQIVQRAYPPKGFAPAQMQSTNNPGFHVNHGFNILRANSHIYWEAISWFRWRCTTVYVPMNVASPIDSAWALIQQKKQSELTPETCTGLTALAYMQNVHLSFYMEGLVKWEINHLGEVQLRALALRLQEVADMLDTVQPAGQHRRRVTVLFGVGADIENKQRDAFLNVFSAADSAAAQGKAHTHWRIAPRLYGAPSYHGLEVFGGSGNGFQFAKAYPNIEMNFKALPTHAPTNLCRHDPEIAFCLKGGLTYNRA
ncbi:hypothetical protein PMIN04_003109 [Paraphaeosphaeria minitans]|uniref:Uncharacterized protein n=1 Tax=Paraphaeosphaeria minitans TaxID=565426 RepID=A0A9P6GB88_9PLEO|nr:hypothetical protein PMIN01_09215 [Paraphaeosphaeria minitans]